ncbi:MAG: hypothetical protein ACRDVM_07110, partial [Acidimicrobiia bacterium]
MLAFGLWCRTSLRRDRRAATPGRRPVATEALTGHFGAHHAVAAQRILGHLDFLDTTITALTEEIDIRTAPFQAVYDRPWS